MRRIFRKILRIIGILLLLDIIAIAAVFLCVNAKDMPENICHGVIRLDTTTNDRSRIVGTCLNAFVGRYPSGGKCSCAVKTLDNGETIVGRNLDNTESVYPIYLGSTDIEGFYRTVYATQLEDIGPSYESCITKGVPKYMAAASAFLATDSLNSEGLYIEINMRDNQIDENGNFVFSCSGTNPDSDIRLNVCELPTYLTLRCKNVDEAVEMINTLDVYTVNDEESWTLCLLMADADGSYGVVEFGCNEVRWLPMQAIQTNYYLSEDFFEIQQHRQGLGRYEYLDENLKDVESEDDMLDLMEGVRYSELYNPDNPAYDIKSEFAEYIEDITNEYLDDEENWQKVLDDFKAESEQFHSMTRDEREQAEMFWISLYTSIVNCSDKTLSLSFYEQYDISCVLDFKD